MSSITSYAEPDERYPLLRVISAVMSWIGAILMLGALLFLAFGALALLAGVSGSLPMWGDGFGARPFTEIDPKAGAVGFASLIWSFGIGICGLQLAAVGSLIKLAIHVEENTRISAQALHKIQSRLEPGENVSDAVFRS